MYIHRLQPYVVLLLLVSAWGGGAEARAQPFVDRAVLPAVYELDGPVAEGVFRRSNASFYPVVLGASLAGWGVAAVQAATDREAHWAAAYRLTLSELGTLGVVVGLKNLVQRPRPYHTVPGVTSRSGRYQPDQDAFDPYAFPSGHAALSFALATSLTLSDPKWYVAVPAYGWATAVALSRVWLGVHYPTDILAGAAIGAGAAVLVYLVRETITPNAWQENGEPVPALVVMRWTL